MTKPTLKQIEILALESRITSELDNYVEDGDIARDQHNTTVYELKRQYRDLVGRDYVYNIKMSER